MQFGWLAWSNPVAIWWGCLVLVSAGNVALLLGLISRFRQAGFGRRTGVFAVEPLLALGAAYVLGCAFRSILPRADVQRICLFDTWLSSVLHRPQRRDRGGALFRRSMGHCVGEVGRLGNSDTAKNISKVIIPLIVLAECCSWYAVITTNYLGNVIENSLLDRGISPHRTCVGATSSPVPRRHPMGHRRHRRGHRLLLRVHGDDRRANVLPSAGRNREQADAICSGLFPACMTSPLAGSLLTISRAGATKSLGCRCISAWRCG